MFSQHFNAQTIVGLVRLISLAFLVNLAIAAVPAQSTTQIEQYDYIVVGSGPGGGPLAANLARANYTVLLIEAGDASDSTGQYSPLVTWDFFVKRYDDPAREMKNHHVTWRTKDGRYWVGKGTDQPPEGSTLLGIYYPRGSALGGSTMINAMATFLPPDSDWNYIVNVTGDSSWRQVDSPAATATST